MKRDAGSRQGKCPQVHLTGLFTEAAAAIWLVSQSADSRYWLAPSHALSRTFWGRWRMCALISGVRLFSRRFQWRGRHKSTVRVASLLCLLSKGIQSRRDIECGRNRFSVDMASLSLPHFPLLHSWFVPCIAEPYSNLNSWFRWSSLTFQKTNLYRDKNTITLTWWGLKPVFLVRSLQFSESIYRWYSKTLDISFTCDRE